MEERKLDLAVTAFNTTPEGDLEFDNGKAKNLDTRQMFLEEHFVKSGKSTSEMNKNGSEDRSR